MEWTLSRAHTSSIAMLARLPVTTASCLGPETATRCCTRGLLDPQPLQQTFLLKRARSAVTRRPLNGVRRLRTVTASLFSVISTFRLVESIFEFTAPPGHGNVSGVVIRDVKIVASNRGIGFQQRTGPGSYTNVTIERVSIEARGVTGDTWWGAGEAIWITVVPERAGLGYPLGGIHGVTMTNVTTVSEQVRTGMNPLHLSNLL